VQDLLELRRGEVARCGRYLYHAVEFCLRGARRTLTCVFMTVEHESGAGSSASDLLPASSESLRCRLAGLPTGEGDAVGGLIGEEWERSERALHSGSLLGLK
jgi:hypothetical protein